MGHYLSKRGLCRVLNGGVKRKWKLPFRVPWWRRICSDVVTRSLSLESWRDKSRHKGHLYRYEGEGVTPNPKPYEGEEVPKP